MSDDLGILIARRRWLQEVDRLTGSLAAFFRAAWLTCPFACRESARE